VTGTPEEYRFHSVVTWQPGRVIRTDGNGTGHLAFALESDLLATNPAPGIVRLLRASTGEELATFPGGPIQHLSRDGSLLVTTTAVWNLRLVRQRLVELGLDWDLPPYREPDLAGIAMPLRVEVLLGELGP
jgi:hypothetical protein